jgi:hypothetical protein
MRKGREMPANGINDANADPLFLGMLGEHVEDDA